MCLTGVKVWTPDICLGDQGSIPCLGGFCFFSFLYTFYPFLAIFRDFQPPKKGLLYQAIPMGPCAFNLNDIALLPKLMAHAHFCALPRNFNF